MRVCRVVDPGILSTVQDLGRRGYYAEGIPDGGAMDSVAFRLGNLLLGNIANAAGIEVLLGGLCLEFLETTWIAITGGDLGAKIDGKEVPMWQTLPVAPGQKLMFSIRRRGLRGYLLFEGGLDVPLFLGSRSTYLVLNKGGLNGRKLEREDFLDVLSPSGNRVVCQIPYQLRPTYGPPWNLRIIYGQQDKFFTRGSLEQFEEESWRVTSEIDRMGLRLKGPALDFEERLCSVGGSSLSNIISEGNPLGAVQYPGESTVIIIGPDGPCDGGFAKLGTIISADHFLLAQIMPGEKVKFAAATLMEAYQELYRQKSMCEDIGIVEPCSSEASY